MGCSSCGANTAPMQFKRKSKNANKQVNLEESCEFEQEIIANWLEKVQCFKAKFLYLQHTTYPVRKLNSFIGVLRSAQRSNPCYFRTQLLNIQDFIIIVTATGQC